LGQITARKEAILAKAAALTNTLSHLVVRSVCVVGPQLGSSLYRKGGTAVILRKKGGGQDLSDKAFH